MSTEIRHNFNYGILYTLIFSFSICNLIINIIFFVSFIIMPASFDIIPRFFTGIGRLARKRTRFGICACRAEIAYFPVGTVKTFARYFYPGAFFIYFHASLKFSADILGSVIIPHPVIKPSYVIQYDESPARQLSLPDGMSEHGFNK